MDQELSPCIVEHFSDIITITICDVICNADTWEDIEEFGKAKEGRFRKYLQLANGISSPDTIRRVFIRLKPEQLQSSFLSWVQALRHTETGAELTAIDGKNEPHCRWSPKPSDGGGSSKRDAMHGGRKHRRCHVSASPMSTCSYPPLITSSAPPRTALGPGAIGYHRH